MKVDKKEWESKLNNLHTRTKGITSEHQIDYKSLLKKVFIGESVLDVGCGTCWLKNYLKKSTKYTGLDAFISGKEIITQSIEEIDFNTFQHRFDTLFVFAALDGMMDLEKAFENMKAICNKNIVILTGINIQPDLYHTHLITEQLVTNLMDGFKQTHKTQVHEKILFLEYTK
ncbi:MAG: hypothetical protein EKK64_07895 [Neisseriaceae bacterium]|nr:MAG: hypothetical protein EKK64_07895 [Neisseriaceae bacterium]